MNDRLAKNKTELLESCNNFLALRNAESLQAREFFRRRIKNIKKFVAVKQSDGSYAFAPAAYVAYYGAKSVEEWEQLMEKPYRQEGRNYLSKLIPSTVEEGDDAFNEIKQSYELFCGDIEPSSGDTSPLRFWVLNPNNLEDESAYGAEWTDEEMYAVTSAYIEMLALEQEGKPYTKSAYNERLRAEALKNRTKSAIEFRMQNISAVLEELCLPRIQGYRPAKNIGEKNKQRLIKILEGLGFISSMTYEPIEDSEELDRRVSQIRRRFSNGQPEGNAKPEKRSAMREVFARDPLVKAAILELADGTCESCGTESPFNLPDGSSYLEVHHVKRLCEGGSDKISNAVAVCPNCHRELHLGVNAAQKTQELYSNISRLVRE